MIVEAIILSLQITAIYTVFQQGMIFGWVRIDIANVLDKKFGKVKSTYIQKPIWDCLPCMSGLWTVLLTYSFDPELVLTVCGMLILIDKILENETVIGE